MEREFQPKESLLSDKAILWHIEQGNIIIDPFKPENLGTVSYDVSLGEWYFQEQKPEPGMTVYSPYSEEDIIRIWGEPQQAVVTKEWVEKTGRKLSDGIFPEDRIIWIPPGETFLCHTEEFIGGRNIVTTMMKARSSLGRNFIEICKCAGWGDVGYINRWTMEVTNNSRHYTIPLVVGRRIAQVAFFEVDSTKGRDYAVVGHYQQSNDPQEIKRTWKPEEMLPKMWRDREAKR